MGVGLDISSIMSYFLLLLLLYVGGSIILRFFRFPMKLMIELLCNSLIGVGLLLLVNVFGAAVGYSIVINPFNVIFVGILGVPGVVCLFLLGMIL